MTEEEEKYCVLDKSPFPIMLVIFFPENIICSPVIFLKYNGTFACITPVTCHISRDSKFCISNIVDEIVLCNMDIAVGFHIYI